MFRKILVPLMVLLVMSNTIFAQEPEEEIIEEEIIEEEIIEEEIVEETVVTEKTSSFKTEISGNIRGDYRYFPEEGLYTGQRQEYFSSIFNPEFYMEWDEGNQLIQFKGFARLNQYDNQQTHADIRELYYLRVLNKWEISLGVKKIYWGFTESNHLVNVINQDDVLEGSDIENKLGQPMLHISTNQKWGTVDFMAMTYFREMQFPGTAGRLRPPFEIDNSKTSFESEAKEYNPDFALRWSHNYKAFDFGISQFYGTSRLPLFSTTNGFTFTQSYELISQTGAELQATTGAMLWKLEAIHRESKRKTVTALTVGGEYTFSNVFKADVGILAEYNFDDRGIESINGLNDDFFVGMRIALNDKQSTDFLGGVNVDRETKTTSLFAEANRRIGDSWKVSIEALGFSNVDENNFIYLFRKDGYVQFSLAKYF
jgi:hypothetical protein